MIEKVSLEQENIIDKETRARVMIIIYLINFNFYLFLLTQFENILVLGFILFLLNGFILNILQLETSLGVFNFWNFIVLILNIFSFGFFSFIVSFNLLLIVLNLFYFKKVLNSINL